MSSIYVLGVWHSQVDSPASSLTFAWCLDLGSRQFGGRAKLESFAFAGRPGRTVFLVTRSRCCNWVEVKHKPVYVSIFIHRASCVGSESVWPPFLKSDVCKQGQSRKVKTPQPRGKKESIVRASDLRGKTSLTALPPASAVRLSPARWLIYSISKCLYWIRRTLLSAK